MFSSLSNSQSNFSAPTYAGENFLNSTMGLREKANNLKEQNKINLIPKNNGFFKTEGPQKGIAQNQLKIRKMVGGKAVMQKTLVAGFNTSGSPINQ